jgi:hypothetical protein
MVVSESAITVRFPPGAADVAVRRCGMDRDPGSIPWLGKTVRLEFSGFEL